METNYDIEINLSVPPEKMKILKENYTKEDIANMTHKERMEFIEVSWKPA